MSKAPAEIYAESMKKLRALGSKTKASAYDLSARTGLPGLPPEAQEQEGAMAGAGVASSSLTINLSRPSGSSAAASSSSSQPAASSDMPTSEHLPLDSKRTGEQEEIVNWEPGSLNTTKIDIGIGTQALEVNGGIDAGLDASNAMPYAHSSTPKSAILSQGLTLSERNTPLRKLISSTQLSNIYGKVLLPDGAPLPPPQWTSTGGQKHSGSVAGESQRSNGHLTASNRPVYSTRSSAMKTPHTGRMAAPLTVSSRGGSSRGIFLALPDGSDIGCVFKLRRTLHVRAGCELDSADVCNLPAGTDVLLVDRQEVQGGTLRACIAKPPVGMPHRVAMENGMVKPYGWVSYVAKDGQSNLIFSDDPAALAVIESKRKEKAAKAASKAASEAAQLMAQAKLDKIFLFREASLPPIATARGMEAAGLIPPRPKPKPLVLKPSPKRFDIRGNTFDLPRAPTAASSTAATPTSSPSSRRPPEFSWSDRPRPKDPYGLLGSEFDAKPMGDQQLAARPKSSQSSSSSQWPKKRTPMHSKTLPAPVRNQLSATRPRTLFGGGGGSGSLVSRAQVRPKGEVPASATPSVRAPAPSPAPAPAPVSAKWQMPRTPQEVEKASATTLIIVLQEFGCGTDHSELIYLTLAQLARLAQLVLAQQAQTTDSMVDLNVLSAPGVNLFHLIVRAMDSHAGDARVQEAGCRLVFMLCPAGHAEFEQRRQLAARAGIFEGIATSLRNHLGHAVVLEAAVILVLRLTDGSVSLARHADQAGLTPLLRLAFEGRISSALTARLDIAHRWLSLHGNASKRSSLTPDESTGKPSLWKPLHDLCRYISAMWQ